MAGDDVLAPEAFDDDDPWVNIERWFPGSLLGGRYRVTVFVARDERVVRFGGHDDLTDESVAIELVQLEGLGGRDAADGLIEQITSGTLPVHADLLPVIGSGVLQRPAALWLASPLLAGGTLRNVLDRGRRLSPSQAVVVGFHIARALAALHDAGVVHGEVTPRHMRFGVHGRVVLAGVPLAGHISQLAWSAPDEIDVERAWYSAPELASGSPPSRASDVYSLCLCLIEAVTGEVPFAQASPVASLGARAGRLMPVSADLGPLAAVLERAGRPDPAERSTALDLAEALVRCAETLARPEPLPIVSDDSAGLERVSVPSLSPDPDFASSAVETPTVAEVDGEPPSAVSSETSRASGVARPRGRRLLLVGAAAVVVLIVGLAMARLLRTPSYAVPDLSGRPAAQVANLVADFDWTLEIRQERSDGVEVDAVIRTEPEVGAMIPRGGTLVLVVSEGPTFVALPDVEGLDVQEAFGQLRAVGLVPVVTAARPDEDRPTDTVLRWYVPDQPSLIVGSEVVKGTEIALEISQGPAPREVPDVVGSSPEDARVALERLRLVANLAEDFSDTVPVGVVVAQNPLPGQVVPVDSKVLVVVSKGPDVVVVPDLAGVAADKVAETLAAADLTLGTVTGDPARRLLGVSVDGVAVRPGDQVRRGSTVSLVYAFAP